MAKRGPIAGTEVPEKLREKSLHSIMHDEKGREIPDPLPLEPPIGYKRSPTIAEQLRAMVQGEALAYAARNAGKETFEEADDFDVDDEFDPRSPYEVIFEPPPTWDDRATKLGELIETGRRKAAAHLDEAEKKKKAREKAREPEENREPEQPKSEEPA